MRLVHKNLLLVALLFSAITAAAVMVSMETLSRLLTEEYEIKGTAIANGIANSSVEILLNRDLATVQALIDQSLDTEGVAYVFVVDAAGDIVAHTFVPQVPAPMRSLPGDPEHLIVRRVGPWLDICAPILAGVGGFVHVGMELSIVEARIAQAVGRLLLLMLVVLLLALLGSSIAIRTISQPLVKLSDYARELASRDFTAPARRLDQLTGSRDEVGELASAFVHMEDTLGTFIGNLKETTAAKERIERELSIAREIQMSLVPKIFPAFIDRPDFELFATIHPAREVGGDLYDFFLLDEHHLFMAMGDVSGKGVPAALFMAVTKTLFKATASQGLPLSEVMRRVNDELCEDNESGMFVTMFCAVLDTRTGQLEFANGGHNPPYVVHRSGHVTMFPRTRGMGLGVMEEIDFETGELVLTEGDTVLLYTDGVVEAVDIAENLYTNPRLEELLARMGESTAREVVEGVLESVWDFSQGAEQADDITMLAMTFLGAQGEPPDPNRLSLSVANDLGELEALAERIEQFGEAVDLPPKDLFRLNLAVEELVTNVINHGFEDTGVHRIELELECRDGRLHLQLRDDGVPFNPLEDAPEVDVEASADEREIGGLGVHLVRSLFDEQDYRREGRFNVLKLSKPLDA